MQGPSVKLLPRHAGILENADEKSREALGYEGHVKEENERGWVLAECGTFVPKDCFEEVDRNWDSEETDD